MSELSNIKRSCDGRQIVFKYGYLCMTISVERFHMVSNIIFKSATDPRPHDRRHIAASM
jgi:hypothetical protein